jgi:hypothetical protein
MTKLEELVLHHILPDTYGDCHTIKSQKKYRRENIVNMIMKWHNQQNVDDGMTNKITLHNHGILDPIDRAILNRNNHEQSGSGSAQAIQTT